MHLAGGGDWSGVRGGWGVLAFWGISGLEEKLDDLGWRLDISQYLYSS